MKQLLFLFAISTCLAWGQVPNYVPTNGLVGWWNFNGNTTNEVGNGIDGVNFGANLTADRFNQANSAYYFDGNAYISMGDTSTLNPSVGLSISVWFKSAVNQDSAGIVSIWEQAAYSGSTNRFAIFKKNDTIRSIINANVLFQLYAKPVTDGSWHHIALTFGPFNAPSVNTVNRIYLDGVPLLGIGTSAIHNMPQLAGNFEVGRMLQGLLPKYYFIGAIDDVGYWNRPLDGCEIVDLYESQLNYVSDSVSIFGPTFMATFNMPPVNYQWINCTTDTEIPFAWSQAYTPTAAGSYAVEIWHKGCQVITDCIEGQYNGIAELDPSVQITHDIGSSSIQISGMEFTAVDLYDNLGRKIDLTKNNQYNYQLGSYSTGLHVLLLQAGNIIYSKKLYL